jgi:hypothetical protein
MGTITSARRLASDWVKAGLTNQSPMIDHQVNNGHSCHVGCNLFEQLEPFALKPYSNELTPVALRQALDKAATNCFQVATDSPA